MNLKEFQEMLASVEIDTMDLNRIVDPDIGRSPSAIKEEKLMRIF